VPVSTLSTAAADQGRERTAAAFRGLAAEAGSAAPAASRPSRAALTASIFRFSFILSYLFGR